MPTSDETRVPRHTVRPLSPLEGEIIQLAEQGMSVREIAYYLSIDTRLVKERLRGRRTRPVLERLAVE